MGKDKLTQFDTREPNAVEKYVCEPMNKLSRNKELSQDDLMLLQKLHMFEVQVDSDNGAVDDLYKKLNDTSLPMKVFEKRLELAGIEVTKGVKIMMGCLMKTPGEAVLYFCYFLKWCKDNDKNKVTMEDWSISMFPLGVFQDDDLHGVWESQKVLRANDGEFAPDNLVDYSSAFISLLPKEQKADEES